MLYDGNRPFPFDVDRHRFQHRCQHSRDEVQGPKLNRIKIARTIQGKRRTVANEANNPKDFVFGLSFLQGANIGHTTNGKDGSAIFSGDSRHLYRPAGWGSPISDLNGVPVSKTMPVTLSPFL